MNITVSDSGNFDNQDPNVDLPTCTDNPETPTIAGSHTFGKVLVGSVDPLTDLIGTLAVQPPAIVEAFFAAHPDLARCCFPTKLDTASTTIRPTYPGGKFDPTTQQLSLLGLTQLLTVASSPTAGGGWTLLDGYNDRAGGNSAVPGVVGLAMKPIDGAIITIDIDFDVTILPVPLQNWVGTVGTGAIASRGNPVRLAITLRQSPELQDFLATTEGFGGSKTSFSDGAGNAVEIFYHAGASANIWGQHKSGGTYVTAFPTTLEYLQLETFEELISGLQASGFELTRKSVGGGTRTTWDDLMDDSAIADLITKGKGWVLGTAPIDALMVMTPEVQDTLKATYHGKIITQADDRSQSMWRFYSDLETTLNTCYQLGVPLKMDGLDKLLARYMAQIDRSDHKWNDTRIQNEREKAADSWDWSNSDIAVIEIARILTIAVPGHSQVISDLLWSILNPPEPVEPEPEIVPPAPVAVAASDDDTDAFDFGESSATDADSDVFAALFGEEEEEVTVSPVVKDDALFIATQTTWARGRFLGDGACAKMAGTLGENIRNMEMGSAVAIGTMLSTTLRYDCRIRSFDAEVPTAVNPGDFVYIVGEPGSGKSPVIATSNILGSCTEEIERQFVNAWYNVRTYFSNPENKGMTDRPVPRMLARKPESLMQKFTIPELIDSQAFCSEYTRYAPTAGQEQVYRTSRLPLVINADGADFFAEQSANGGSSRGHKATCNKVWASETISASRKGDGGRTSANSPGFSMLIGVQPKFILEEMKIEKIEQTGYAQRVLMITLFNFDDEVIERKDADDERPIITNNPHMLLNSTEYKAYDAMVQLFQGYPEIRFSPEAKEIYWEFVLAERLKAKGLKGWDKLAIHKLGSHLMRVANYFHLIDIYDCIYAAIEAKKAPNHELEAKFGGDIKITASAVERACEVLRCSAASLAYYESYQKQCDRIEASRKEANMATSKAGAKWIAILSDPELLQDELQRHKAIGGTKKTYAHKMHRFKSEIKSTMGQSITDILTPVWDAL